MAQRVRLLALATSQAGAATPTPKSGGVAMWPYVKNLVPHQVQYNYARFQDVWMDK